MGRQVPLDDARIVRVLKALADPTRFRMVQEIAAAGELSCGEVQEHFDVSQPTISHHLKILTDAGVVVQRIEGKHRYTSVDRALVLSVLGSIPPQLVPAKKRVTANSR
ncbi:MAG: metalloregulator ArsR/SmtB family transcription factor [Polyangiaceae bacterium]